MEVLKKVRGREREDKTDGERNRGEEKEKGEKRGEKEKRVCDLLLLTTDVWEAR